MFDRRKIQHAPFGKGVANTWFRLRADVRDVCTKADETLFYAVIKEPNPEALDGVIISGGVVSRLGRYFTGDYYCGFVWRHPAASFTCYVNKPRGLFYVVGIVDTSRQAQGGLQHVG